MLDRLLAHLPEPLRCRCTVVHAAWLAVLLTVFLVPIVYLGVDLAKVKISAIAFFKKIAIAG